MGGRIKSSCLVPGVVWVMGRAGKACRGMRRWVLWSGAVARQKAHSAVRTTDALENLMVK